MVKELFLNCEKSSLEFYQCIHCDFKTHIGISFWVHLKKIHLQFKKNLFTTFCADCYTCKNCNFSTFSLLLLFKHNLTYQHITYKRKVKKNLAVKMHKSEDNFLSFFCDFCEFKSKAKRNLKRHIIARHTENVPEYECNTCNYKTRYKGELKVHNIRYHTAPEKIEWHQCKHYNICKYKTLRKGDLKQHIIRHHTVLDEVEWHQCKYCTYKFKIKSDLTQHVKVHLSQVNVSKYRCTTCEYKTLQKSNLKRHIIRMHKVFEKEKWHQSKFSTFRSRSKRQHTKIHEVSEKTVSEDIQCVIKTELTNNIKIQHMSEGKASLFYCDRCEYTSERKANIDRHILAKHTSREKVPKYECNLCDFKTIHKSNLKMHHIRRHTASEKMQWYQCEHCTYRSKIKNDFTLHVQVQHYNSKK